MIERYTIKFGPAVSQKELEKIINTGEGKFHPDDLKKMRARIEFIGDVEDVKKVSEMLKELSRKFFFGGVGELRKYAHKARLIPEPLRVCRAGANG